MWCCILLRKIKGAVFVPAYPLAHMPIKVVVVYIHPEALIQVHPKFNMAAHQCRRKSSQTFTGYISDSAVVFSAVVSYSLLVTIELYSTARQSIYKWLMNTTCSQILSSLAASASSIWLITVIIAIPAVSIFTSAECESPSCWSPFSVNVKKMRGYLCAKIYENALLNEAVNKLACR